MRFSVYLEYQREGTSLIYERLDRCVANWGWCELFPRSMVIHGSVAYLNHAHLLCQMEGASMLIPRSQRPFRFKAMWIGAGNCEKIIEES